MSSPARNEVRSYYEQTQAAMDRGELPDQRTQQSVYLLGGRSGADTQRRTNLFLARRAGVRDGERLLDAGCGTAGPAVDIARRYADVSIEAVTLAPAQVTRARERIAVAGLGRRVRVHEADYHRLAFPEAHFDRVLYLESLFHSDDLGAAMAEAHRLLRPGGTIYVKDMLRREGPLGVDERRALERFEGRTRTRVLVASEVVAAMTAAGFEGARVDEFSDRVEAKLFFEQMRRRGIARLPVYWGDIRASKPRRPAIRAPLVFALGGIGFDFGTEARRDSFVQAMGASPYDPRRLLAHLEASPADAHRLIWTLELERTPIYALAPVGSFGAEVFERLRALLASRSRGAIERASVAGRLRGRSVRLFSGQRVPELELSGARGLYGWSTTALVEAALADAEPGAQAALCSFLDRLYHETRNLGRDPSDRALNYAATNAMQSAFVVREAVRRGLELADVDVRRSPTCRPDHDCWDVDLRCFDPSNIRRAERVYRFCVDVSDLHPVTVGAVRSWSERRRGLA